MINELDFREFFGLISFPGRFFKTYIFEDVFFPIIFILLRPLPRQHWASFGCKENVQLIGVSVSYLLRGYELQGLGCGL